MDNTTLLVIGAIVVVALVYFSKKNSAVTDVKDSLPPSSGGNGKVDKENTAGIEEK
jgi:hypothetical protein